MTLLEVLIAASKSGAPAHADSDLVEAPAEVDPAYTAYVAELARANAARKICKRCGGAGYLNEYAHINGGRCFRCDGAVHTDWVPLDYTEWLRDRANALDLGEFPIMVRE